MFYRRMSSLNSQSREDPPDNRYTVEDTQEEMEDLKSKFDSRYDTMASSSTLDASSKNEKSAVSNEAPPVSMHLHTQNPSGGVLLEAESVDSLRRSSTRVRGVSSVEDNPHGYYLRSSKRQKKIDNPKILVKECMNTSVPGSSRNLLDEKKAPTSSEESMSSRGPDPFNVPYPSVPSPYDKLSSKDGSTASEDRTIAVPEDCCLDSEKKKSASPSGSRTSSLSGEGDSPRQKVAISPELGKFLLE